MSNAQGHRTHGSKGGKYARKRKLDIDFSGLEVLAEKLDNLGANLEKVFGDAMEKAGEQIQADTVKALAAVNLPAKGKYSKGATEASVAKDVKVRWGGGVGEMPLGFEKTVVGAGGWLITGTPRMSPDRELAKIYSDKKSSRGYEKRVKEQIRKDLQEEIERRLGG